MKILLLEDDSGFRRHIKKYLEEYGHQVKDFRRIDTAKEYFINNSNKIDLVVIDLNMDDEFLGEYILEADGGEISGWVFLQRFIYPIKPNIPTVIFSGVVDKIEKYVDKSIQTNIHLIPKCGHNNGGIFELISVINSI